jgi:hypothetical protein
MHTFNIASTTAVVRRMDAVALAALSTSLGSPLAKAYARHGVLDGLGLPREDLHAVRLQLDAREVPERDLILYFVQLVARQTQALGLRSGSKLADWLQAGRSPVPTAQDFGALPGLWAHAERRKLHRNDDGHLAAMAARPAFFTFTL